MAKTAIKVDKARLLQCLEKVESGGGLANRAALFTALAEAYNLNSPRPVSASFLMVKVKDFGFEMKTKKGKKGKSGGTEIDSKVLQASIVAIEEVNQFPNWGTLFVQVAERYNDIKDTSIASGTLQSYAVRNNLTIKTAKGKKGRVGGVPMANRGPRIKKAEKFASNPAIVRSLTVIEKYIPKSMRERLSPLMDKIKQGSRTAALKMNCLQCSGFVSADVRNCEANSCPIWPFRPYQGKAKSEGDNPEDEDVEVGVPDPEPEEDEEDEELEKTV